MLKNMTVSQVAKRLRVSTVTIYSKLRIKKFKEKVTLEYGRQTISEELLRLINDTLENPVNLDSTEYTYTNKEFIDPEESLRESHIGDQYKSVIETLTEQLKVKDVQIAGLQRLLENFQVFLQDKKDHQIS
jgi:hypothetical protein